ncbi:thioredoxin H5-like [Panicum miliaceum]|uniref:Thioredoxin H5-like n=1 Tax=Panicum miliaceum TaxID=4540 RepID=A0A3L6Q3H1_PANMI|nr:thioredoxin H5-like [Panicum miliaceum]
MSSASRSPLVIPLKTEDDLQQKLESAEKLVVLEFVKQGSMLCKYLQPERDKIAEEMKEKADFYELDVNTFKTSATKWQVEALPAFLVMKKSSKKRHVVGTEDLKQEIEDAHKKFVTEPKEAAQNSVPEGDSQLDDGAESNHQPAQNSSEQQAPNFDSSDHSFKWYSDERSNTCSIL